MITKPCIICNTETVVHKRKETAYCDFCRKNKKELLKNKFDGDYWHKNPEKYGFEYKDANGSSINSWWRDGKITCNLIKNGYRVFRFWEKDIKKDATKCVEQILNYFHPVYDFNKINRIKRLKEKLQWM